MEKRNDLFKRKEVQFILEASKTPSFTEASKLISDHFKAPEEHIMVERVKGNFGTNKFTLMACIYDTKELKEEAIKRLIKKKKEEKKE